MAIPRAADSAAWQAHEARRLAALAEYAIMDSEAEAEFDALVRVASQLCGTPIALINFVDEARQWPKAGVGVCLGDIPREHSFCAWAIEQDSPFEVADVRADPRFADNPLVTGEPSMGYYLGVPLTLDSGYRLGTLCVADTRARRLAPGQVAALEDLARVCVQLLEKRAEMRRAEARHAMLEGLLDSAPDGIVACDAQGVLSLFNLQARKWHAGDPLELGYDRWAEHFNLFEPDGETPLAPEHLPLLRALKGHRVRNEEICIKALGHAPRYVSCNGRSFSNAKGERLGAVVSMHDVTERKKYESDLATMRRYLQAVIDASTEVAILAMDDTGTITLFNPGAERLLGYRSDEVCGRLALHELMTGSEFERYAAEIRAVHGADVAGFEVLSSGPDRGLIESRDWTLLKRDERSCSVRLVLTAIHDHSGGTIGYLAIGIDTSQLRATEEALRTSEAQFRSAFNTAPQGMALVSLDGGFMEVNRSLCDMLGYARDELLGIDFQTLTHPEDLESDLRLIKQLVNGEIAQYAQTKRYFTRGQNTIWAQLSVSLVRDAGEQPLYFVSQIQDITERRQLDRLKSEFVAVVSHELRTPITSIKGALALLDTGTLGAVPASMQEIVGLARRNAERLGLLVNDLLDWEKLAADRMPFDFQRASLRELLEDAAASNRGYADNYGVHLELVGEQAAAVEVDPLRFAQVMANLLSNAIKFSPAGETVSIRYRASAERVHIEVEDRGPGIPVEFRARVFQMFSQAESGNTRRQGGTGLGLAIAKQLIEQMQGRIGFHSETGRGTRFWLELPRLR